MDDWAAYLAGERLDLEAEPARWSGAEERGREGWLMTR